MVENAVKEVYMAHHPKTMIIADLGCCAGSNTFLFISSVIDIIADQTKCTGDDPVELQFFRSIQTFKRSVATNETTRVPPLYYISGLPETYYSRLFPCESVHLFHSEYCLHWRSKVF